MSDGRSSTHEHAIYPAYTFRASPTYFAWVKLTAADIHSLRRMRNFEGQNLYFHLNHPIRFITVTGPIVSIEDLFSKFVLLTVDDGSGLTIAVKIKRLEQDIVSKHSVELASNTVVANVNVSTGFGVTWDFNVQVDGTSLNIGTVVKAKGVIEEFRGVRQIDLKRIKVLHTTAEEVREWAELAKWKTDTLNRPWYLGKRKLKELEEKEEADARRKNAESQRKVEKQRLKTAKAEKMRAYEEKMETKRRKEEMMFNHGALI